MQAELNKRDKWGRTAFGWAAINGHLKVVKLLLQCKASAKLKDDSGRDALMLAAEKGHLAIVKLLETVGDTDSEERVVSD